MNATRGWQSVALATGRRRRSGRKNLGAARPLRGSECNRAIETEQAGPITNNLIRENLKGEKSRERKKKIGGGRFHHCGRIPWISKQTGGKRYRGKERGGRSEEGGGMGGCPE